MNFLDLGRIEYSLALSHQLSLVEEVIVDPGKETVLFCSHDPVVTLGKASQKEDLSGWEGPVVSVQRGGRATYHGPGQVVAYPILHLGLRKRDIYLFLRQMEWSVSQSLLSYGVSAKGQGDRNATGVWVGDLKIASIGVAVKRWVTYHGVAINLDHDPLAFTGINPCGFSPKTMVSLEEILGRKVPREEFQLHLQKNLEQSLGLETEKIPMLGGLQHEQ